MKVSNIVLSTTLLSVSLMALPNEGELILPPSQSTTETTNFSVKNADSDLETKSSDEIIQLLDDVNKKRIEYEELKSQQREKEKQKDKDYVLDQIKKDNQIYEEKLKTLQIQQREIEKADEIQKMQNKTLEGGEFRDAATIKVEVLRLSQKSIKTEYKVDGDFSISKFGNETKIKVPAIPLGTTLEMLMNNVRDYENISKQIIFYEAVSKNTNIDFLKENKKFEEIYTKTDYISLKGLYAEGDLVEFKEGDTVYGNIIITNLTPKSYTLKYFK